jgi:hypothetical protein
VPTAWLGLSAAARPVSLPLAHSVFSSSPSLLLFPWDAHCMAGTLCSNSACVSLRSRESRLPFLTCGTARRTSRHVKAHVDSAALT